MSYEVRFTLPSGTTVDVTANSSKEVIRLITEYEISHGFMRVDTDSGAMYVPENVPAVRPATRRLDVQGEQLTRLMLTKMAEHYPDGTPIDQLMTVFGKDSVQGLGPVSRRINSYLQARGLELNTVRTSWAVGDQHVWKPGPMFAQACDLMGVFLLKGDRPDEGE